MTRLVAIITRFYEVFPSHWLVIGSTNLPVLQDVTIVLSDGLNISASFCQLSSPSIKFSKGPDQGDVKSSDFIAFLSVNRKASVSALLINGQSVICSPVPLNSDTIYWPSQLQNVLTILRVHQRSKDQLEKLLYGGLMAFVQSGEHYWLTHQSWMKESFELSKIGCQFVIPEITFLHVVQSSDHHMLLSWLRLLCSESWCMTGQVHVLVIIESSYCPEILKVHLQNIYELEQISLEIVVPVRSLSMSECMNLGVYLAQSKLILLDLSLCMASLMCLMTHIRGHIYLEPHKLIYPVLKDELISILAPPMLFRRQSYFELGGVMALGSSRASMSKQLISIFLSDSRYGVRECLYDQDKALSSCKYLNIQDDTSSKSAWDLACENYVLGV